MQWVRVDSEREILLRLHRWLWVVRIPPMMPASQEGSCAKTYEVQHREDHPTHQQQSQEDHVREARGSSRRTEETKAEPDMPNSLSQNVAPPGEMAEAGK